MEHQRYTALGVNVDQVTRQEAQTRVRGFLHATGQYTVFTPNPEILVAAARDVRFKDILNSGSLNICDGMGVALVSGGKLKRIPGVEFMQDVCQMAQEEGKKVYLLGSGDKKVIAEAARVLKENFPKLAIVGFQEGPKISDQGPVIRDQNEQVIDDIIARAPDILFVGFGHKKQEMWINEHREELPSVKVLMGVGGSFDFIAGFNMNGKKVRRAPQWMRSLGLEWLWRVATEPWRIKRIWNATVIFLYYVIKRRP